MTNEFETDLKPVYLQIKNSDPIGDILTSLITIIEFHHKKVPQFMIDDNEGHKGEPDLLPEYRKISIVNSVINGNDGVNKFTNLPIITSLPQSEVKYLENFKFPIRHSIHELLKYEKTGMEVDVTTIVKAYFDHIVKSGGVIPYQSYNARLGVSSETVIRAKQDLRKKIVEYIRKQIDTTKITVEERLLKDDKISDPKSINDLTIQKLDNICDRLIPALSSLRNRVYAKNRLILEINDEWDLLYYLQGILLIHFEIVKPEEYTPSYNLGSAKIDFYLENESTALEIKFIHKSYSEKDISGQIDEDYRFYSGKEDIELIYALVYDPHRKISQTQRFVKELERHRAIDKPLKVYVVN